MPTIPRANRRMNDSMRKERAGLEEYMYGGEGAEEELGIPTDEGPDAAVIAIDAEPPLEEAAEAGGELTVLDPGMEDPPDMYVYAQGETPGTWTMYPPGVPCDEGTTRIALDHPATAEDLAQMDAEMGTVPASGPVEAGIEEGY